MKATIDIKTLAGQSLEGFPLKVDRLNTFPSIKGFNIDWSNQQVWNGDKWLTVHPGDTITIKVEK